MADRVMENYDLYAGIGMSPMTRPNVKAREDEYQGSFGTFTEAKREAQLLRDSGDFDWWIIIKNETNPYASWSSGLTGIRQRGAA